MMMPSMASQI
jgi:hypothetical protein